MRDADRARAWRRRRSAGRCAATTSTALMTFYDEGRAERRLRGRHPPGAAGDPRQPAVPVPPRAGAGRRRGAGQTYRLSDLELASRLSFFLWGTAPDAELLKVADAGHAARRPACSTQQVQRMLADPRAEALSHALRGAVAAAAGPREDPSRLRCCIRTSTTRSRDAMRARDRAVLRQPRARGPQRARPADRRLHVRQRAAGAALRHSRTSPATSSAA